MKLVVIAWVLTPSHTPPSVRAELVEAGARSLILLHACVKGGSRVIAPAGDSLSYASPKESKQRKGDPQSATPTRCVGANLRRCGCGVRRGTRFALRAPLGQPRRASPRSMGASTPMPPHSRPAAGAASRGAEHPNSQQSLGPSLRSALGRVSGRSMCLVLFQPTSSSSPPGPSG